MTSTRRRFLRSGWKLGGTILTAAAGWTTYESLRPLVGNATGAAVELGTPSNYAPETATYVSAARLFVANTGSYLYAISQKCPHLGCRVPFCESSGQFECPCHGSKYNIGGEWIEGPAPRGMDRYPLTLDSKTGTLTADTSTVIVGPPRGANQIVKPAKGPSCIPKA
ncbi:MAG: Rieske 2Fe-2S domain-containing protein [Ilumatobacteraceae bacterium]